MAAMGASSQPEVVHVDVEDDEPVKMESLCMNCYQNGTTTMLLTKIPHFREIMVCSFDCPHCNTRNNEVSFTGSFAEKGIEYTLSVPKGDLECMSRQVVKSDSATVTIPELHFEIPAATQKGSITTVEGLLSDASDNLKLLQDQRREADAAVAAQIDSFLERLDACRDAQQSFTVLINDPAGNSYIESPSGHPQADPQLKVKHFERTREQSEAIGLSVPQDESHGASQGGSEGPTQVATPEISAHDPHHGARPKGNPALQQALGRTQGSRADKIMGKYAAPEEVLELPGSCYACGVEGTTKMFQTSIPFFKVRDNDQMCHQHPLHHSALCLGVLARRGHYHINLYNPIWTHLQEVIIMSNACDTCGYRNAEVKAGGGISEQGSTATLAVQEEADLQRDVIKSEHATVEVPELDLELSTGTLGGLVTTVEGLLDNVATALKQMQSFNLGDSAQQLTRQKWGDFFKRLDDCIALRQPWTLVLRDPLANSFIGPAADVADVESDPRLRVDKYDRSAEEDEHFGIDHLRQHEELSQDAQKHSS